MFVRSFLFHLGTGIYIVLLVQQKRRFPQWCRLRKERLDSVPWSGLVLMRLRVSALQKNDETPPASYDLCCGTVGSVVHVSSTCRKRPSSYPWKASLKSRRERAVCWFISSQLTTQGACVVLPVCFSFSESAHWLRNWSELVTAIPDQSLNPCLSFTFTSLSSRFFLPRLKNCFPFAFACWHQQLIEDTRCDVVPLPCT